MSSPALKRVVRRETHSSRTVAMIIAAVLVILALLYVAVEVVLRLAGLPALLLEPLATFGWIVGLPTAVPPGASTAAGIIIGIVGLVLVLLAITPGRLAKHELRLGDRAVVADNGVIASAIAQRVSEELGLRREDVRVGVGHRTIDVAIRPHLGIPLDRERAKGVVQDEIDAYGLRPRTRVSVREQRSGQKEMS